MTPSDDELDEGLLAHVTDQQRKVMRVVTSYFHDIGYECESYLLWGFGKDRQDAFLDRCLGRIQLLTASGRILSFGDISKPRYSEICFPPKKR